MWAREVMVACPAPSSTSSPTRPSMRTWPVPARRSPPTSPEIVVLPAATSTSPVTVPATKTWPPLATRSPSTRPSTRTVPPEAIRSPCTVSVAGTVTSRPDRTFPPSSDCWTVAAAGSTTSATARSTIPFISGLPSFGSGTEPGVGSSGGECWVERAEGQPGGTARPGGRRADRAGEPGREQRP